jgi:hypothetical protein
MDKQEPTVQKGLKAEMLNSAVWLERIIYSGIGLLLGLILGIMAGIGTREIGSVGSALLLGIGLVVGFYVVQSFALVMWATWGYLGKILAALVLGPGVGLVILGIGDLIRWAAFQLYKGEKPVYFAFLGWKSKSDKPGGTPASP